MKKHSVGLLELETAILECFLEKTPLNPLGVRVKVQKFKEVTIRSWRYFVENQPQKIAASHSMGSRRL
jgi:hypothetical protein